MERTALIVAKEHFKKSISEQIDKAKQIRDNLIFFRTEDENTSPLDFLSDGLCEEDRLINVVNKWRNYVMELLKQSFNIADNEYVHEFSNSGIEIIRSRLDSRIQHELKILNVTLNCLESIYSRIDLMKCTLGETVEKQKILSTAYRNIFIVHGHDGELRTEVELLIKQLDYNPIVLFKEPNQGKTIIEKIEDQAENAIFGIVLYTGCDLGADKNNSEKLNLRARQNVVFEHGYLSAKLGRAKVCAIRDKEIEIPGDLSGVVYIDHTEGWQYRVANEMRAAGLDIDMNKIKC